MWNLWILKFELSVIRSIRLKCGENESVTCHIQINLKQVCHNLIKTFCCFSVFSVKWDARQDTRSKSVGTWPVHRRFDLWAQTSALQGQTLLSDWRQFLSGKLPSSKTETRGKIIIGPCGHEDMASATDDCWSTASHCARHSKWRSWKGNHIQDGGECIRVGSHLGLWIRISMPFLSLCQDCCHLTAMLQMKIDRFLL